HHVDDIKEVEVEVEEEYEEPQVPPEEQKAKGPNDLDDEEPRLPPEEPPLLPQDPPVLPKDRVCFETCCNKTGEGTCCNKQADVENGAFQLQAAEEVAAEVEEGEYDLKEKPEEEAIDLLLVVLDCARLLPPRVDEASPLSSRQCRTPSSESFNETFRSSPGYQAVSPASTTRHVSISDISISSPPSGPRPSDTSRSDLIVNTGPGMSPAPRLSGCTALLPHATPLNDRKDTPHPASPVSPVSWTCSGTLNERQELMRPVMEMLQNFGQDNKNNKIRKEKDCETELIQAENKKTQPSSALPLKVFDEEIPDVELPAQIMAPPVNGFLAKTMKYLFTGK
uniref:Uncharacterized protein n=1 Tax=Panagrolaimus sp. ES5 TaxID=591445 RepID=A0AC34FV00_9BILA